MTKMIECKTCKTCKKKFEDNRPRLTRCKPCYLEHRKTFKKCKSCDNHLNYKWQKEYCAKCYNNIQLDLGFLD